MNELQVGDNLYCLYGSQGKVTKIVTIERVTKTQAISGNYKFRRDYGSFVSEIHRETYSMNTWKIESEELKLMARRQKMIRDIKGVSIENLEDEKLISILEIINTPTNE